MRRWSLLALLALLGCPPETSKPSTASPTPSPPVTLAPVESASPAAAPPVGEAPRTPWVGLVYGLRGMGSSEILVKNVVPGSPAAEAGVVPGDVIVAVDRADARVPEDVQRALERKQVGDDLIVGLLAPDGKGREATLRVIGFDRGALAMKAMTTGAKHLAGRMVDGGWPRKGSEGFGVDVALSALCLKALVELPEPIREGHVAAIDSAVEQVLRHQSPEGAIVGAADRQHYRTYATALTLQALTRLGPAHAERVQVMRDFLVRAQLDDEEGFSDYDFPFFGAWNYYDQNRRATIRADVSGTAYAAEAISRAGVAPVSTTARSALLFLRRAQNLPLPGVSEEEAALLDGGFSFAPRDSKAGRVVLGADRIVYRSYGSATADGLRALLALGVPRDDERVQAALGWLGRNFSLRANPGFPQGNDGVLERGIYFYWLDGLTDALGKAGVEALTAKDGKPVRWRDEVARRLISLQRPDGSWEGEVAVMNEDDPAQATAFALLCLARCVGGQP